MVAIRQEMTREITISLQFLTIEPRFVRKGCAEQLELAILSQFWRSNLISCEKVRGTPCKSQFYFNFWRSNLISCERVSRDNLNSHFYLSFWRSNLISCERVRGTPEIAILLQFLTDDRTSFRAKGLRGTPELAHFTPVFDDRTSFRAKGLRGATWTRTFTFVRKGARDTLQIAILLQFLAIEPRFVGKGCVSCRLVGTALAPA